MSTPDAADDPASEALRPGSSTPETANDDDYEFPVLAAILETYYATGRELLFLERYERSGGAGAEFEGLVDDLTRALRKPKAAAQEVNLILGSDQDQATIRQALAELRDQCTGEGIFSPEAQEQARIEEAAAIPSTEAVVSYYALRRVSLPAAFGSVSRYQVPLWLLGVAMVGVLVVGIGMGQLPLPGWLDWLALALITIGGTGVAVVAVAMLALRAEVRHPEREAERAEEKAEYEAERAERRQKRRRLLG